MSTATRTARRIMRHVRGLAGGLLCSGVVLTSASFAATSARDAVSERADLIERTLPAVVNVLAWHNESPSDDKQAEPGARSDGIYRAVGSGFVIDPSGVILTNKHVIENAEGISVGFADKTRAQARVLAVTRFIDLALLKVNVDKSLPALRFGESAHIRVGDPVLAIGNPLGIGVSVTSGIVSAIRRDLHETPFDDFLQTDAAINHGNSGGPLIDAVTGDVIGVDSDLVSPTTGSVGLGFAIAADDARFVAEQLLRYGRTRPGWLGVTLQDVTSDLAKAAGLSQVSGAIIVDVDPAGSAARATLRPGDMLIQLDGKDVADARELVRAVGHMPPGQATTLGIWRDGMLRAQTLSVGEWPGAQDSGVPAPIEKPDRQAAIGLHLSAMTDELRDRYGLGAASIGVVVTAVDPGSAAAFRDLHVGDVILQVQAVKTVTPLDVETGLAQARTDGRVFAMVLVQSKDGRRWTTLAVAPLE